MLEKIKELLGEELAGQVEAALKGKGKDGRDIDLVIGNDGSYVPAEKVETERQARTSAETALKNAAAALKGVGGSGDPAAAGAGRDDRGSFFPAGVPGALDGAGKACAGVQRRRTGGGGG